MISPKHFPLGVKQQSPTL